MFVEYQAVLVAATQEALREFRADELRKFCKELGLATNGKKEDFVARLFEDQRVCLCASLARNDGPK